MKKFLILSAILLLITAGHAQLSDTITENFDGATISFSSSNSRSWRVDTSYYKSYPNAYRGQLPNMIGDTVGLITSRYDFTGYGFVYLRFSHICKIAASDIAHVEYRIDMGAGVMGPWQAFSNDSYKGTAANYLTNGFNAGSYTDWQSSNTPNSTWWKDEFFDIGADVGRANGVEFRFFLKHGTVAGTQAAYGWLLDNIEIVRSNYQMYPPTVQFVSPLVMDTVYSAGPYTINAKVKTNTRYPIVIPVLKYTATYNNSVVKSDSIVMTHVQGDSLWSASIPQFLAGTTVSYSITGRDSMGNTATNGSDYVIQQTSPGGMIVVQGNGINTWAAYPFTFYSGYSQAMVIYPASAINAKATGIITSVGLRVLNSGQGASPIKIWLRTVPTSKTFWDANDNLDWSVWTGGATLVYDGTFEFAAPAGSSNGWVDIPLQHNFVYDRSANLVIMAEQNCGGSDCWNSLDAFPTFYGISHSVNRLWFKISNTNPPTINSNLQQLSTVPDLRINVAPLSYSNSVALTQIVSPDQDNNPVGGQNTPIEVVIRNKGSKNLDSCLINWEVNGVLHTYKWTGSLPWSFDTSFVIGNYTPRQNGYDTIRVWVSMPNGVSDSLNHDDMLSIVTYGCPQTLSGSYTVGTNGQFKSVNEFITLIKLCAPVINGNITLLLESDTIRENWNIVDLNTAMGNYILTLTSAAHHRDSVVLSPLSGAAIELDNSNNVRIEEITVDVTGRDAYAIWFASACDNITVTNCNLFASPTSTSDASAGIYMYLSTGIANNITIKGNVIKGGNFGIHLYGTWSTSRSTGLLIDSNTISNANSRSIWIQYADFSGITRNRITSRTEGSTWSYWYGIYLYSCNGGDITGNRILQRNVSASYGISAYYLNSDHADLSLIANNEIMLNIEQIDAYNHLSGIYVIAAKAKILHNSIYISQEGNGKGIGISHDYGPNDLFIKNNHIVLQSQNGFPLYITSSNGINLYDIDANNLYAPASVGAIGTAVAANIAEWKAIMPSEKHSVSVSPAYIDMTSSLELSSYTGLMCAYLPGMVESDINGNIRPPITTMGAYNGIAFSAYNAALTAILNWNTGRPTDSIQVVLMNSGTASIGNAAIDWSFNGAPKTYTWSGALQQGEADTLTLGAITYNPNGDNHFIARIANLGSQADQVAEDDTVQASASFCNVALSGRYTVGTVNDDFMTLNAAIDRIKSCGVQGDIRLEITSGSYSTAVNLVDSRNYMNGHHLTITSAAGKADSVILQTRGIGFLLSNSNNLTFKNITIDARQGNYAVQFSGACTNVLIRDCRLLADTIQTYGNYAPVFKDQNTGGADSIFIINNLIYGGYFGVRLYGLSTAAYATHIVIDSNKFYNQAYIAVSLNHTDALSCSHNTILSRQVNSNTTWTGVEMSNANGPIIGNRIIQRSTAVGNPRGISLMYYHASWTSDTGFIANNEIMIHTTSFRSAGYGISISNSPLKVRVLHNSINVKGGGNAALRGLSITDNTGSYFMAKNNIILTESGYPIYIGSSINGFDIDYNNYKSPSDVGYIGNPPTSAQTISAWQQAVPTDRHSISQQPEFVDISQNMELRDSIGFSCPAIAGISTDINGNPRGTKTTMGAYQYVGVPDDIHPLAFVGLNPIYPSGTPVEVKVRIINPGSNTLTSAKLDWIVNGNPMNTVPWNSTLLAGDTTVVSLGSLTLNSGETNIVAYTSLPNGMQDVNTAKDTIRFVLFACDSVLSGIYTVGTGGNISDIETAVKMLKNCGASGDVTLALLADTFDVTSIDLTGISSYTNNHTLTLTSATGNAVDAVIRPTDMGIILSKSNNIVIRNLTVLTDMAHAICFTDACTNVVIRECRLLPGNYVQAITKLDNVTGILDSIFISSNIIDGGTYGIYINGGPGIDNYGKHVLIDSNKITNTGYGGIYLRYVDLIACCFNTVESSGRYTFWTGFELSRGNGPITNNRIIQRSNNVTTPTGISLLNHNYYNTANMGLVANNEIILNMAGGNAAYPGIKLNKSYSNVLHNSIYVAGDSSAYGIQIEYNEDVPVLVKRNNIVLESQKGYPIHISPVTYLNSFDLNQNNMYAPQYVGNIGGTDIDSMYKWQNRVPSDDASIRVLPAFINPTQSLQMQDTVDLPCPIDPLVPADINGIQRIGYTNMGAYGLSAIGLDAGLMEITFNPLNTIDTVSTPVLTIINMGATPVDSVLIYYSYNGAPVVSKMFTVNLSTTYTEANVDLDTIRPLAGMNNTIKAWIGKVNNTLLDSAQWNDTINFSFYGCNEMLNGTYTVGTTGNFQTIEDFLEKVQGGCVNGPVRLEFQSGNHSGNLDLASVAEQLGTFPLTITSVGADTSQTYLIATSGAAITLGNNQNVSIKDITINCAQAQYGIHFTGACSNIVISGCHIIANPATTANNNIAIYKEEGRTDVLHNIRITNNRIDGGYNGLYLYGGIESERATQITVDSNQFNGQAEYGIYAYHTGFNSISGNSIISRTANIYFRWFAMELHFSNGTVIANNRIRQQSNVITVPGGIMLSFNNYSNSNSNALIANNEIILSNGMSDEYYGLRISSSRASVVHNSIHMGGTVASRGIDIYDGNVDLTIKNNLIAMTHSNSWPVYIRSTAALSRLDIDYNNYYAPQYIGYVGQAVSSLESWKQTVLTDRHSVRIMPDFANTTSLELNDYSRILASRDASVSKDINGINREVMTAMGAYTQVTPAMDVMLASVVNLKREVVNNEQLSVQVEAMNVGSTPVNDITFGWSVNGGAKQTFLWTATPNMASFAIDTVTVGSFAAMGADVYDVNVWIESINNSPSIITVNDTVSASGSRIELLRFVAPLVADTTHALSFAVYAAIHAGTGATMNTPRMAIETIIQDKVLSDTLDMAPYQGQIWAVSIPQQYYGSKVIYSLTVSDTVGNTPTITDSTYLQYQAGGDLYAGNNLSILSIDRLTADGCIPDYAPVRVTIANTGTDDYDFTVNPVSMSVRVTNPIPFHKDTVLSSGGLVSGAIMVVELTGALPIVTAGEYDVKTWLSSPVDNVAYDDTLLMNYVSGKFGLPVDENFNTGTRLPEVFYTRDNIGGNEWRIVPQGTGADTVVKPQEGAGMLAFSGAHSNMSTLSSYQLDLSRSIQPVLSFWYFHDTVPCDDYTDVRITMDGGNNYQTLFSLTKYDATYGWKQYDTVLSAYAADQCVFVVFEAMEKSANGDVTQYMDHILITAKQEIVITDIFTSELSVCNLKDREWNVVLTNSTAPVLDYGATPISIILELMGTSHRFTHTISSGILQGFSSDTFALTPDFDFIPGMHIAKAYIASAPGNIFMDTVDINPKFAIEIEKLSGSNLATAGFEHSQKVTIKNTGNMELSDIGLILTITSDDGIYTFNAMDTFNGTLQPNDTADFTFDSAYIVPWSWNYDVKVHGYLLCDSMVFNEDFYAQEQVDIDDLYIVDISSPQNNTVDTVNSLLNVSVNVKNRSLGTSPYSNVEISLLLTDTNGNPIGDIISEYLSSVSGGQEIAFTFSESYRVPAITKYHLTVFIEQQDNYTDNDTMRIVRETTSDVHILERAGVSFTMEQNIPNPAKANTIINYRIPQDGEIIFQIHSVSGQILYNKVENVPLGEHQIDLNLSDYASGIYFYSMEYKGHRIVKRMSVK